MPRKSEPKNVDVVQIVQQVRRTIEKRESRFDNAGTTRERVRDRLIHKISRAPMPDDVKQDLINARMEWIFDPESFWWSRRPGIGPFINMFRRIAKPIVKLFFNPDAVLHHLNRLSYLVIYQQQLIEDLFVDLEFNRQKEYRTKRQGSKSQSYRRTHRTHGPPRNPHTEGTK